MRESNQEEHVEQARDSLEAARTSVEAAREAHRQTGDPALASFIEDAQVGLDDARATYDGATGAQTQSTTSPNVNAEHR